MFITECVSKKHIEVDINVLLPSDFKKITKRRYFFNWKSIAKNCRLFKLTIRGDDDILGLLAITDYPNEERTEIVLLTASIENVGKEKQYDRIAGCLIAFAGNESLKLYKRYPCISLLPKTNLKQHYMLVYNMLDGGRHLFLEDNPLMDLIEKYML